MQEFDLIYSPSFFDTMEHLAVDVHDEEVLRGTIQYGWIYPMERPLRISKEWEDIRSLISKCYAKISSHIKL